MSLGHALEHAQDEDEDLHVLPTNQKGVVKAAL